MMNLRSFFRSILAHLFLKDAILGAAILFVAAVLLALWNPLHAADAQKIVVPSWQLEDDQFVWIKIVAVDEKGNVIESLDAPDCNKIVRIKTSGEEIAPGVYAEGLAGGDVSKSPNIRTFDERESDRQRYCRNTLPVMINEEMVAWPADATYARLTQFGIPRRDDEVRIRMPLIVYSLLDGNTTPRRTVTPSIVIPIERFGGEVVIVKVVYTPSANLRDWADSPIPSDR